MATPVTRTVVDGVNILVRGAIQDLRYDQTIEAIVTSTDNFANGEYTVKADGASFKAYAEARYYVNDMVYVMIPQGDFNNQKFITGRKVDEMSADTTFNLKLPFDNFIGLQDLTPDFVGLPTEERGFIANHGKESYLMEIESHKRQGAVLTNLTESQQADYDAVNLIGSWSIPDIATKPPVLATKLAISMNVSSFLAEYRPLRGRYGLRLEIGGYSQTTEEASSQYITQEVYFTNQDMYGNTYAFLVPTVQQKIFDISSLISIDSIKIYFYQDHNFLDEQNDIIPWVTEETGIVPDNLFLSDFNIYFGLTTDDINDERVFLYTYDDVKYGYDTDDITIDRSEYDARKLQFAWVHRDYAQEKFVLVNTPEKLALYQAHIFWYQLEYDVQAPTGETEKLGWRLAPPNWKYLGADYDDQFQITVCPSIEKSREKYMAIVSFSGSYKRSETLVFTNVIDVDSVNEALAANKNYIFKIFRPATSAEKNAHLQQGHNLNEVYTYGNAEQDIWLVEDNTVGNFFVYDENNKCLTDSDAIRYSDREYYILLYLLTRDVDAEGDETEGHYNPLFDDDESNFKASISFPQNYSMLSEVTLTGDDPCFGSYLKSSDETLVNRVKQTIKKFKINYFWNLNYNDNIISAEIERYGHVYYANKEFIFGQAGSQGSEYTIKIHFEQMSNYAMVKGEKFTLGAYVYDRNNRMLQPGEDAQISFNWELLGPSIITPTENEDIPEDGSSSWTKVTLNNYFSENGIEGYVRNDYPPIFKVTVQNAADYPISAVRGFVLTNGVATLTQQYIIFCPNRVEYKSDGSSPIYDTSEFMVETIAGLKEYPTWELLHVENGYQTSKYFQLKSTNYEQVTVSSDYGTVTRPAYTGYKLISNINTLDNPVPHYWDPAMESQCYMCLSAIMTPKTDESETEVWIRQAIPFTQNVYSSSLINSWDNSLTLDEENGAVLATMMSAGTKDSQNRFTGVIMGDWQTKGDSSLDVPGLYGFAKGAQRFGFKTDGTGFIGEAGKGQIQFDGTQALIKSADGHCYMNLNPMKYTFNDLSGTILDDFTKYSYSPYFLYSRTKRTSDTYGSFADFTDSDSKLTSWTKEFFEDSQNDYFIVDPNNGILTTGGVIARYGKIGNWMISENGLYQRYDPKDTSGTGRYMYLGFSSQDTRDSLDALKIIYDQKYFDAYLDYLNQLNARTVKVYPSIYEVDPIHYWNQYRGIKLAREILIVTLNKYTQDPKTSLQKHLENTMAEMITDDFIDSYNHMHFCSNDYSIPKTSHPVPKGTAYTGDRTDVYVLLGYTTSKTSNIVTSQDRFQKYDYIYDIYCDNSGKGRYATEAEKQSGKASDEGYYIYDKDVSETRYLPILKEDYARATDAMYIYSAIDKRTNNKISELFKLNTSLYPEYKPVGDLYMWEVANGKITTRNYLNEITVSKMEELIQTWEPWYQTYLAGYQYLLEEQRKLGYQYVLYKDRKDLEDAYDAAKAQIDTEYAEKRREIHKQDDGRYAIFAGEHETSDPIFYVKWQGDMFARRGIIANSWVIDDTSLTYRLTNGNNFDIIYMGSEEGSFGRVLKPNQEKIDSENDNNNDSRRWAISAGEKVSLTKDDFTGVYFADKPYEINFGVRTNGEMYAQKGTIAGWHITKNALTKYQGDDTSKAYLIKLNSAKGKISIGEQTAGSDNAEIVFSAADSTATPPTPPTAQIGSLGGKALITLAGYKISANTTSNNVSTVATVSTANITLPTSSLPEQDFLTATADDDNAVSKITTAKLSKGELRLSNSGWTTNPLNALQNISIKNPYYFQIEHPNAGPAFNIYSVKKDTSQPESERQENTIVLTPTVTRGILGSADYPWYLISKEAYINTAYVEQLYMYDKVQSWYNSLKENSNGTFGGYVGSDVEGYMPIASRTYVNFRLAELGSYTAAMGKAVYNAFVTTRARVNKIWTALGKQYDENGNVIEGTQDQIARLKQAVTSFGDATSEADGAGSITIDIPYSTIGGTGGTITINFNMADTEFFKKNGFGSIEKGSGGTETSFEMGSEEPWSGDTRSELSRNIKINVMAPDGETVLGTISVTTDGQDPYDAGWAAAVEMCNTSISNNVITVSKPSDTVDTPANDEVYTITTTAFAVATSNVSDQTYVANGTYNISSYADATATARAYINGTEATNAISKADAERDWDSATITVNVPTSSVRPEIKEE